MLKIVMRTATDRLKIRRSMARLFQSYLYSVLPEKEHNGYLHKDTGKRFKSTNFKISYNKNIFTIYFTALNSEYEQMVATDILKNGIKFGDIKISDINLSLDNRELPKGVDSIKARGFVSASIKNALTKRKISLEPGDYRHREIIKRNSIQKYEAIYEQEYSGEFDIEPIWQTPRYSTFWYENTPYIAWEAIYILSGDREMINLLLKTGLGSDTMKNLGFLKVL